MSQKAEPVAQGEPGGGDTSIQGHVAYVQQHGLHVTVGAIVTHLVRERPDHPKKAILEYLRKVKEGSTTAADLQRQNSLLGALEGDTPAVMGQMLKGADCATATATSEEAAAAAPPAAPAEEEPKEPSTSMKVPKAAVVVVDGDTPAAAPAVAAEQQAGEGGEPHAGDSAQHVPHPPPRGPAGGGARPVAPQGGEGGAGQPHPSGQLGMTESKSNLRVCNSMNQMLAEKTDGMQRVGSFRAGSAKKNIEVDLGVSTRLSPNIDDEPLPMTKRSPSNLRKKSSIGVLQREIEPANEPKRRQKSLDDATPRSEGGSAGGSLRHEASSFMMHYEGFCQCNQQELMANVNPKLVNAEAVAGLTFHTAFHECVTCKRRPAMMMSCVTTKSYCKQHAYDTFIENPLDFLWIQYELLIYERAFYCFKCQEHSSDETEQLDEALNQLFDTKGTYMKEPVIDMDIVELVGHGACASMQGWRSSQEDGEVLCKLPGDVVVAAVFDGHGGTLAAGWIQRHLLAFITDEVDDVASTPIETLKEAITRAFYAADEKLSEAHSSECGCIGSTCCLVIVTPTDILCANIGDSRAVLSRSGEVVALSTDQTLEEEEERQRVAQAGYTVTRNRIEGTLSVPRAFGDYDFKQCGGKGPGEQAVSVRPEYVHVPRDSAKDQFILVACDGVWDGYDNEQAVQFVEDKLNNDKKSNVDAIKALLLNNLAPELDEEAIGTDNQTCILLRI